MYYIEMSGESGDRRYYLGMDGHAEHQFGPKEERKIYATSEEAETDRDLIFKEDGYHVRVSKVGDAGDPSSVVYEDRYGIGHN